MTVFAAIEKAVCGGGAVGVKKMKELEVPAGPSICVGHSFGCFPALRAAGDLPDVRALVLLAPAIAYGRGENGCGLDEDGEKHVAYVSRSRPHTFRLGSQDAWHRLYSGELDLGDSRNVESLRMVLGVVGEDDPYFDQETLSRRFEPIVRHHIGGTIDVRFSVSRGAAHGAKGLLGDEEIEWMSRCLD